MVKVKWLRYGVAAGFFLHAQEKPSQCHKNMPRKFGHTVEVNYPDGAKCGSSPSAPPFPVPHVEAQHLLPGQFAVFVESAIAYSVKPLGITVVRV